MIAFWMQVLGLEEYYISDLSQIVLYINKEMNFVGGHQFTHYNYRSSHQAQRIMIAAQY
jgi:hypothetical protein